MFSHEPISLPVAVRAYPEPSKSKQTTRSQKPRDLPGMLVFDTETRTDATQRLTFGSYRFFDEDGQSEELFSAADLPKGDRDVLKRYVDKEAAGELQLLVLRDFLDELYRAAYKGRCLLVGFNLPFDLSRLAYDYAPARGRFAGGFSLGLWSWIDKLGREHPNRYRPRIGIKQIDSKRALKGFTARNEPDKVDLIPEDSETGEPEKGYKFRGHFLDLRTLAFALTDRSYSLGEACKAFEVEHRKQRVRRHGLVTKNTSTTIGATF